MLRPIASHLLVPTIVLPVLVWLWLAGAMSRPLSVPVDGYELVVTRGAGLNLLADNLVEQGLARSALPLKIYVRLRPPGEILAGDYLLVPGDTLATTLTKLTTGAVQRYTITFAEGLTLAQWRKTLMSKDNINHTLAEMSAAEIADSLGIEHENPEGWFAPDTYVYLSDDSDLTILRRAHQRMETMLANLWTEREDGLPYKTPYEALVMASIIEKETGAAEERAQIAGVFVRRLRKDMRLQTDPTIIYGLGPAFNGNLTRKHLDQLSPYNTYRYTGLPPTPIANPGMAALEAALHPASGNELFFVAKGDGSHHFSASLKEHNKAVRDFQIDRRAKAYRSSAPAAPAAPTVQAAPTAPHKAIEAP